MSETKPNETKPNETKPNETKPNETKPKKMVGRSVALALAIICIILIALIAYFTVTGISAENSYNNLQDQNKQLQTWLNGNETLLGQTQTWLAGNITAYDSLNSTYNNYVSDHHYTDDEYDSVSSQNTNSTNIANLADSIVWVNDQTISQPASAFTVWTFSANYAGYASVWVQSSSVAGTHVKAIYSSYGVSFNQEIVVSAGGNATFPILPSSSIQIEVGNANLVNGATETVMVTYYY